jgi:aspartyl-tRNA(Asn)/glutamyl-tRNA(Gln) amidotransferase subunit C
MSSHHLDIDYVANLARVELSEAERAEFGPHLRGILDYVEKLKEIDVTDVEPMAHPFPLVNVMRPDERRPSLTHDEAMSNAPQAVNGLFQVPKIVE